MSRNTEATDDVKTWTGGPLNYKEGFFTQLATDELAKGINEEVVRAISAKRNEPEWMLEFWFQVNISAIRRFSVSLRQIQEVYNETRVFAYTHAYRRF